VIAKIVLLQTKTVCSCLFRFKVVRNYVRLCFEGLFKPTIMKGKPYYLTMESGNICNLSCVLCPTGQKRGGMNRGFLSFENFKKILDKCGSQLLFLEFFNWGEPFLNQELLQMIDYARQKNIFVVLSSNMNFKTLTLDEAKDIVRSGLTQLMVFCAGASDHTIKMYQVGASFQRAYSNMKMIMTAKKFLGKNTPFIQWRFLITKYTESEIEIAKALSKEGCDYLTLLPINCDMAKEVFLNPEGQFRNVEEWLPKADKLCLFDKTRQRRKNMQNRCSYLWSRITVNWNGDVFPCCKVFGDRFAFGNLLEDSLEDIWNGMMYRYARKVATDKQPLERKTVICQYCKENKAMT